MSEREQVSALLDVVPDYKLGYVLAYLRGIVAGETVDVPNAETIAAMRETDAMIATGSGEAFTGSTADFFAMLDAEDEADADD